MGKLSTHPTIIKMYEFSKLLFYAILLRGYSNGQMTGTASSTAEQKRYRHYHHHHLGQYERTSPEDMGLRPAGLDETSFFNLKESTSVLDDPNPMDLNSTALRIKLGADYEPAFMSVHQPAVSEKQHLSYLGFRRNRLGRLIPTGTMPDYLSKIDFKYLGLTNGSKLRSRISPKLKRKIQQFLWAYTGCSVVYRWEDLGLRFWPRYLKISYCPRNVSCSVPPGMTCTTSAETRKTVLRWICKKSTYESGGDGDNSDNAVFAVPQRRCHWMKCHYPMAAACSCSCSDKPDDDY